MSRNTGAQFFPSYTSNLILLAKKTGVGGWRSGYGFWQLLTLADEGDREISHLQTMTDKGGGGSDTTNFF